MKVFSEFRDFAMKGNVVDLAVAVIIGTAFGKIVTSLVEDILMPIIAWVVGSVDFSNLYWSFSAQVLPNLSLAEAKKLWPVLAYGNFLTTVLNFLIIAFCIFLVVRAMTRMMPKKETAPAGPTDIDLLKEIRDILKQGK